MNCGGEERAALLNTSLSIANLNPKTFSFSIQMHEGECDREDSTDTAYGKSLTLFFKVSCVIYFHSLSENKIFSVRFHM